jgi:hypothetical protein
MNYNHAGGNVVHLEEIDRNKAIFGDDDIIPFDGNVARTFDHYTDDIQSEENIDIDDIDPEEELDFNHG